MRTTFCTYFRNVTLVLKIFTFLPSGKKVKILSTLATFQKVREKSHPYFFSINSLCSFPFPHNITHKLKNNYTTLAGDIPKVNLFYLQSISTLFHLAFHLLLFSTTEDTSSYASIAANLCPTDVIDVRTYVCTES